MKLSTQSLIMSFRYRRSWLPRVGEVPHWVASWVTCIENRRKAARDLQLDNQHLGKAYVRERELIAREFREHLVEVGSTLATTNIGSEGR